MSLVPFEGPPSRKWFCRGSALLAFALIGVFAPAITARQNLQPLVSTLMHGRHGAVIASNPATGEILAVWNPVEAFDRIYPPGSTAKVVTSTAALEEGVISPDERDFCHRVPELLGEAYHCSHPPPDGPFNLASALSNSCNYFFSALSLRLTSTQLEHWYAVFGFGSPVDGMGHGVAGQVRVGGTAREKALAALGEQTVLVTPAQLLLAYSAIATRGPVFHLWRSSSSAKGPGQVAREIKLRPGTYELLNTGLLDCVQSGMGQGAAVPGISVAGKTGTATALDGTRTTHAWFVGYAPADKPKIAVVIFLERGTGARDAAPLAGKILRHYFSVRDQEK
ncbi:MAG TPA: penicillin-binding transpeptidase domain-containing protein [Terriglobia bacterium]|nr:penicillin-binding transpeptidase domain-containing protein [Terriglobia bacterium]